MKQDFTDPASFLKAVAVLREGTFLGSDLVHDAPSHTLTLTVTHEDRSGGRRRFLRTSISVRRIVTYRQSLAGPVSDVFVLDRAEVGRGGSELSFYFRPGDRAVMDVEQVDATVEDVGAAKAPHRAPVIVNPILKEETGASARRKSIVARLLGR